MEDTIKISDIRPDNPAVVEAMIKHGYAVVTQAYLEQCCKESAELAKIKSKMTRERGRAIWEEDI